jgi:hypothetical protein
MKLINASPLRLLPEDDDELTIVAVIKIKVEKIKGSL